MKNILETFGGIMLGYLLACGCLFNMIPSVSAAQEKPNLVIILADDLGWNAVGYHNDRMETPNIDRIVSEGMELDHFYVAPMCSPTRAGLMTGRYPIRFGCARAVIPPQRDHGLPTEEITLGEALRTLGYQNRGIFGKWHLGHRRTKWHPLQQGFSEFVGHYNGAIDYFDLTREGQRDWHHQYTPSRDEGYATDLIAEAATQFISRCATQDSPYFCYVPFNAPHSPFQAPEEAIEKFEFLNSIESIRHNNKKDAMQRLQVYSAMIWKMDQGIGRILEAIDQSGESENTIVWFLSDNGGVGNIWENNLPLRGSKLTVYEGGIRVPAAVRWPDKIQSGSKLHSTVGYIDLFPTLIEAAGGKSPFGPKHQVDGKSLLPVIVSKDQTMDESFKRATDELDQRPWFSYHGQQGEADEHLAVMQNGWKLKVNGPRLTQRSDLQKPGVLHELFYIATDPNEERDLSRENMETVMALADRLVAYRKLQPDNAVPRYSVGSRGFEPPKDWKAMPENPDQLLGRHNSSKP